jgi:hypothetical protein
LGYYRQWNEAVPKKKANTKARRKKSDAASQTANALGRGAPRDSKNDRPQRSITNERLRKLAKKHRPPDEYFAGDVERPW